MWPIFYGTVILPCILKTIWCMSIIIWDYESVWPDILPQGERGGSVVECRTPEREVRGSRPTSAVLCPWARHFTPRKYWLITQEAMTPSRHDWKIVDWDVKPQHNQILPQNNCRTHYDLYFMVQWFCIIFWRLSDVWTSYLRITGQYDQTFDLKVNVSHCDLYFTVLWFCLISWRLFDACTSYFGIMNRYDPS